MDCLKHVDVYNTAGQCLPQITLVDLKPMLLGLCCRNFGRTSLLIFAVLMSSDMGSCCSQAFWTVLAAFASLFSWASHAEAFWISSQQPSSEPQILISWLWLRYFSGWMILFRAHANSWKAVFKHVIVDCSAFVQLRKRGPVRFSSYCYIRTCHDHSA